MYTRFTTLLAGALLGLMPPATAQQVFLNLQADPGLSSFIYTWEFPGNPTLHVVATNMQTNEVPVVFQVFLNASDGSEVAHSNPQNAPVIFLPPMTSVWNLFDVVPFSAFEISAEFEMNIVQTGQLPEGNYSLCIQALAPEIFVPISSMACASFFIQNYMDPVATFPMDGMMFTNTAELTFQWTPVMPMPQFAENYFFKSVVVLPGQVAQEAIAINPPLMEIMSPVPTLQWPIEVQMPAGENVIAWQVTPLSNNFAPYTMPTGSSLVSTFTFNNTPDVSCSGFEISGWLISQNGIPQTETFIPTDTSVNVWPEYNATCSDGMQATVSGYVQITFTDSIGNSSITILYTPDETISFLVNGTADVSFFGNSICGTGATCFPTGITNATFPVGNTTTDGGGGNTVACLCIGCNVEATLTASNYQQPTPGGTISQSFGFSISGDITCNLPACNKVIEEMSVTVAYTDANGNSVTAELHNGSEQILIPVGQTFSYQAYLKGNCDGSNCECYGMALEVIVSGDVPRAISGTPATDNPPTGEYPVPEVPPYEKVPPDTTTIPIACSAPTYTVDAATPISLGMSLDAPDLAPYPRAVPLKALGKDFDYVHFFCDGCEGGPSRYDYPVEDRMLRDAYKWELKSKLGSLNDPFRTDSLNEVREKIDSVLSALAGIEERRKEIDERLKTGIAADSTKYAKQLETANEAKQAKDSLLVVINETLTQLADSISLIESAMDEVRQSLEQKMDSVLVLNEQIDSLKHRLTNPPSEEELMLLEQITQQRNEMIAQQQQLETLEQQMLTTSQQLAEEVDALYSALDNAMNQYYAARDNLNSTTQEIVGIETQLYSQPLSKNFLQNRRESGQAIHALLATYPPGATLSMNVTNTYQQAKDEAMDVVTASPINREELYESFSSTINQLNSYLLQCCGGLEDEDAENCADKKVEALLEVAQLDSSVTSIIDDEFVFPAGLLEEIETLRASLPALETQLYNLQNTSETASENYLDAVSEFASTMQQMEEDKTDALQNLESATAELVAKETEYTVAKSERQSEFENNEAGMIEQLYANEMELTALNHSIELLEDSLIRMQEELDGVQLEKYKADAEKLQTETDITRWQNVIDNLEAKLEALAQERTVLKQELEDLDKKEEELKKLLEELKKLEEQLLQPTKFATGPIVYYIPPPLEEVMKLNGVYPDFEKHIQRVEQTETALKEATAKMESLQAMYTKEIIKMSKNLAKYKKLSESISQLSEDSLALAQEIGAMQTEFVAEYNATKEKLEALKDSADVSLQTAQDMIYELDGKKIELLPELENTKAQYAEALSFYKGHKITVDLLRSDLAVRKQEVNNSATILKMISDEYDAIEKNIIQKQVKLDNARSGGTVAAANENAGGVGAAQATATQLENEIETLKAELQTVQTELASNAANHSQKVTELTELEEVWDMQDSVLNVLRREKDSLFIEFDSLNTRMEWIESGINHFTKAKSKGEQLIAKIVAQLENFSAPATEALDEEEDIAGKKEELAELSKQIKNANNELEDLVVRLNTSVEAKDKLKEELQEKLDKAKEDVRNADDSLKIFLREQFEKVKFDAEIELTGYDEVVDHFRAKDAEKKLTKKLEYRSTRTPFLENEYPSGGLPTMLIPAICIPDVVFQVPAAASDGSVTAPAKNEPRTIALLYQNGRPLWPEWPVFPDDVPPLIAKDVVPAVSNFPNDKDIVIYGCASTGECPPTPPNFDAIVDIGTHGWEAVKGKIIGDTHYNYVLWEPAMVEKPKEKEEQEVKAKFFGVKIMPDSEVKGKTKPTVYPGVLLEVTDTLVGVPDTTREVQARVVTGDHKGLAGETIEFSCVLLTGMSEEYGFGGDTLIEVETDGDGYAKTNFDFGNGFAKFQIYAKWKRGDKVIDEDEFTAIAPIIVNGIRISTTPHDVAWEKAMELFISAEGLDEASVATAVEEFPTCDDGETQSECANVMRGIAGLLNIEREFVEDEWIEFSTEADDISLDPEKEKTNSLGLSDTKINGLGEDRDIELTAAVEEKYEEVGMPAEDEISFSSKKIEEFKIGADGNYFTVVLDEPAEKGVEINGTGKIKMPDEGIEALVSDIINLALTIDEVEVDGDADDAVATLGLVWWHQEGGISATQLGFTLTLDSLFVRAELGAGIAGTINHNDLNNPAKFTAEISPSGDFLGTISELPSIEKFGFKLEEGAAVSLDWHDTVSPQGVEPGFKGIYIHEASLQLPEMFQRSEDSEPTKLSVEKFSVGNTGLKGTATLEGDLLKMGFSGFAFEAKAISITFDNSNLTNASFTGAFAFTGVMEGSIEATIAKQGDTYKAELQTDKPVYIPRLKTAFALQNGTGIAWNSSTKLGTLTINGNLASDHFDPITITGFEINSKYEIKADAINVNNGKKFAGGFAVFVNTVKFKKTEEEFSFYVDGKLSFPLVPELSGSIEITPGPEVTVTITGGKVEFEKGPVTFKGGFAFAASEFRGDFEIGIKKIAENGIKGLFIIGTQDIDENSDYTYWYVELSCGVKIPIGQTGLSILQLGGGVGVNYAPPVGGQEGSPVNNNGDFSFKAILGLGNTPNGEVFEGRMEMVYQPGKFSLYGKVWLLKMEENLFGEGQLNVYWSPDAKLDGFVRMLVKLPDAEGKVLDFDGKVNFLYSASDWYVKSEKIEGSFLQAIHANATIDVTQEHTKLDGEMYYKLDKKFDVAVFTLGVYVDVNANANLQFVNASSTLDASVTFNGSWNVTAETSFGNANLISGNLNMNAQLHASPSIVSLQASANVSWSIWFWEGSQSLDLGYTEQVI